jgi:hypothetical protein
LRREASVSVNTKMADVESGSSSSHDGKEVTSANGSAGQTGAELCTANES